MKALRIIAATALFIFGCICSKAQTPTSLPKEPDYNKPKIFSDLPENLDVNISNMESLLSMSAGAMVNTVIANGLRLTGTVVSKSNGNDVAVKSVVIKTTNRAGAIFTFTRLTNINGTISYSGRIVSTNSSDALQIIKEGDHYLLRKQGLYDLLNE